MPLPESWALTVVLPRMGGTRPSASLSRVSLRRRTHLEDVGEVSEIENVVEFDRCGQKSGGDFLVEGEGQIDELGGGFPQGLWEVSERKVLSQDGAVDGGQGVCPGEGESKHAEVALDEKTGRGQSQDHLLGMCAQQ